MKIIAHFIGRVLRHHTETQKTSKPKRLGLFVLLMAVLAAPAHATTLSILPIDDRSDRVSVAVSLQVDIVRPYNFPVIWSAQGLPAGLSIDRESGLISGTPTDAGDNAVSVRATSSLGEHNERSTATFNWLISANSAPVFNEVHAPRERVSVPIAPFAVTAFDAEGDVLTYSSETLPDGLSIDAATGVITGTPSEEGEHLVSVSVRDDIGAGAGIIFSWTIALNQPPVLEPLEDMHTRRNILSFQTVTAHDPDGDELTYSTTALRF
jgi:hypothetical protein